MAALRTEESTAKADAMRSSTLLQQEQKVVQVNKDLHIKVGQQELEVNALQQTVANEAALRQTLNDAQSASASSNLKHTGELFRRTKEMANEENALRRRLAEIESERDNAT